MGKLNSKLEIHKDLVVLAFADFDGWFSWLRKNNGQEQGVWLKLGKKQGGVKSITYVEAREAAIIFGWIDGLINKLDDRYYLTKFTQRRKRSKWSKINREIAEQLIAAGRMHEAGLAQVESAKQDGRWEAAYDSPSTIQVPPELKKMLDQNKPAKLFFETISSSNRYAFLYRIQNAKRPETKQRHLEKTIEMLSQGKVYHPKLRKKK